LLAVVAMTAAMAAVVEAAASVLNEKINFLLKTLYYVV
jgi:hypothetical protein